MGLDMEAAILSCLLEIKPVPDFLLRVASLVRHLAAVVLVPLRLALGLDPLNALVLERNFAFLKRRLPEQHPRLLRVEVVDILAHVRNIDGDFVEAEVLVRRLLLTLCSSVMLLTSLVTRGQEGVAGGGAHIDHSHALGAGAPAPGDRLRGVVVVVVCGPLGGAGHLLILAVHAALEQV